MPVAKFNVSDTHDLPPGKKRKYTRKPRVRVDTSPSGIRPKKSLVKRSKQKTGRKRGRKREETPEGAETKTIDPTVVTMQDLCQDLRIGKKSKNHDEIMGRIARGRRVANKSKIQRGNLKPSEIISPGENGAQTSRETRPANAIAKKSSSPSPQIASGPSFGPRIRIVDGQIVTDELSLQIDRHQQLRENTCMDEDIIEENDFSRIVTSGNYLKRERSPNWTALANELFWKGLRMFGTDFEMIAKMFPRRTRRQIKLKFNAEERLNPQKMNRVLMGTKTETIDLDEFQRLGNLELEDLADIKAEEVRIEQEQSEYFEAIEEARKIEINRRKSEIHGNNGEKRQLGHMSDDENESLNGNLKRKIGSAKHKKTKKNMNSIYGGGEEVVVLETYE